MDGWMVGWMDGWMKGPYIRFKYTFVLMNLSVFFNDGTVNLSMYAKYFTSRNTVNCNKIWSSKRKILIKESLKFFFGNPILFV